MTKIRTNSKILKQYEDLIR